MRSRSIQVRPEAFGSINLDLPPETGTIQVSHAGQLSLLFLVTSSAQSVSNTTCQDVGGGITTNFIDATDSLGSATGDLAGGLGVSVLGKASGPNGSIILHVHHHWVTVTGEILSLNDAHFTLFPTPVSGFYAGSYLNGIIVNGNGTGRYKGASGKTYGWGAADLNKGQVTLRYSGQVCVIAPTTDDNSN